MQKREGISGKLLIIGVVLAMVGLFLLNRGVSAQDTADYSEAELTKVMGAFSVQKGINRVYLRWSGPECETVRWDFGDGTGAEGATTTHIYEGPGHYTITAYGYTNETIYWGNTTIYYEGDAEVLDVSGSGYHITVTNTTLMASGIVMLLTSLFYPHIKFFFEWNTPKLRMALGLLLIFSGALLTPGVLPDSLTGAAYMMVGVLCG